MIRKTVVKIAVADGWKPWGHDKRHEGMYQTFRKGNNYLWIGNRFIEHPKKL